MGYKDDNKRQKTDSNDTINNIKTYITNVTTRDDSNQEITTKPFDNTTNNLNEYKTDSTSNNTNKDNSDKKKKNKKKKRKKMKKNEIKSNETVAVINSNDSSIKITNNEKIVDIINDITGYLNDWFNQSNWKFSKKLQHCLITNCLNEEIVNEELFELFVKYSVTIAGNAKERLVSMANDTLANHSEDDNRESNIVYMKAKQLIETLTVI